MDRTQSETDEELSPAGLEALLKLVVASEHSRVSSVEVDGRTVWIKRYGVEARSAAKWLHRVISPLMPLPFLRSSPAASAAGLAAREMRKAAAFRAAGFPTVTIFYGQGDVIAMSDAGTIVQEELNRLRRSDPGRHDDMLVACAEAVARVHLAGLCHGRPHPRDMLVKGRMFGFLDFEEEPEASMPLETAQARDVWLLFLQIAGQTQRPETPRRAFAAYRQIAPPAVIRELRRVVGFFSLFNPVLRIPGRFIGRDGQRMLAGTSFLKSALSKDEASHPNLPGQTGELRKPSHD